MDIQSANLSGPMRSPANQLRSAASIKASLDQARAQLGQNQAQLQVALIDLKRYQLLSVDNGVSRQTLDQQQALVNQLKASAQGDQATIAAAQVQLSYTQIQSPVSGRVGIRAVDAGNFLRVSDAQGLFSVTQIDPIAVEFSLPQQQLPLLHELLMAEQPARVKAFIGNADNSAAPLGEGRLSLIDNQVSATTGTIKAKAQFDNPTQSLWPGQLVNVEIQTGLQRDALVVPPQVVQRGLDNYFVYRVSGDKVETVPVQLTFQDTELSIITGVNPGSEILREEIFGPVLSITTFTDEADAVAKANDTEYGLVSYVYTQDFARGQRLIETLQTGMMGLNVGVVSNAAAPFGGMKQSGVGREGGFEGIHEYLETKYVLTPNPFA